MYRVNSRTHFILCYVSVLETERKRENRVREARPVSTSTCIAQFLFAYTATYSLDLARRMDKMSEGGGMKGGNCEERDTEGDCGKRGPVR